MRPPGSLPGWTRGSRQTTNFADRRLEQLVKMKDPGLRFWSKVDKTHPSGCWLWAASTKNGGYGQFRLDGKTVYAHRLAYQVLVGPIPDGHDLDHLCRTPSCLNPAHLEPVTHRENMARGHFASKSECPSGHPYDETNTAVVPGKRPTLSTRKCRRCNGWTGVAA